MTLAHLKSLGLLLARVALAAGLLFQMTPANTAPPKTAKVANPLLGGDPRRGAALYETRCSACHSIAANRIGPMHRGVVGRKAGTVAGFDYLPALKRARIVWNAPSLDRWLTNPPVMVPGTRMGIRVPDAKDRADIIAYLRANP